MVVTRVNVGWPVKPDARRASLKLRSPMVQTPVAESYSPSLGMAWAPCGTLLSVTLTPGTKDDGPLFTAMMV